ncbi:MAG: triose-phosphate isomerase [Halobacteriovoraceae bacterium]|jgi:triosephosphate isomerase (TIM)|nr:triose-phosphate isomerase [Halobacteriovoraceae bacterium]
MAKTYMIGNWKMNQTLAEVESFFANLSLENNQNNFWISPQTLHVQKCITLGASTGILIGSQNCSDQDYGAYTGEVSTESLIEMGGHFSLVGHSERRAYYQESDEFINKKIKKSIEKGLVPVLCIGETLEQREAGDTFSIVLSQLKNGLINIKLNNEAELIVAYEPVWAIGTGKTASPEQAAEVHDKIREKLREIFGELGEDISILYGGSVKPSNVATLLAQKNINGGLVGGASLKSESFAELCAACSL